MALAAHVILVSPLFEWVSPTVQSEAGTVALLNMDTLAEEEDRQPWKRRRRRRRAAEAEEAMLRQNKSTHGDGPTFNILADFLCVAAGKC